MPDLAAFDFDGTLTRGGSVFGFLSALAGPRAVVTASIVLSPRLALAALAGGTVADRTKELLFERVLAGVPIGPAEEAATAFANRHLAGHLRTTVRDRFDWHRQRGDRVVIVSASPDLYVRVAGDQLGADGVIATHLAVSSEGALTGRYEGPNCRGAEKLRRLGEWIEESGERPARLWAYGNSRGDLSMLRAADVGINVGRLGLLGRLRSFPAMSGTGTGPTPG